MLLRFLTGLVLVLAAASAPATSPTVKDWLSRSMQAAKTLNYQGNLVYAHGGDVSNLRFTHVRDGDQEWEHLVKVDGKQRAEVLRGGNDVIYRSSKGEATRMSSLPAMARPLALGQHLDTINQFYDSTVSEGSHIAGRDAVRLELKPHDQDRYGFEFYVDTATGLLLKSVMLDENGKPLEAVSFSEIQIGPSVGVSDYQAARHPPTPSTGNNPGNSRGSKPVARPNPTAAPAAGSGPAPAPRLPAVMNWQFWMPTGFVQLGPVRHKLINGVPVVIATYSDGLSSFSFFTERLMAGKPASDSQRQHGSTAIVSRQRSQGDSNWLISVVGELPLSVASHIADSAVPTPPVTP